jgi:hypothetical protein
MSQQYPPLPTKLVAGGAGGGGGTGDPYYPPTPGPGTKTGGAATDTTGAPFNRQEFIKAYAGLVAHTWADPQFLDLLLASPVDTLNKAGLYTIPGAVIRIIQHKITGSGKIEDEVDAWVAGNQTGLYDLFLPYKPDNVAVSPGGGAVDAAVASDGGNCCCCSPCCCCT